jgi:hypothetical protein
MPAVGFESTRSFCQLIFGPPLDHSGALEHPEEQHFAHLTADQQVPGSNPGVPFLPCGWIPAAHHQPLVTAVGFEPTPLRTGALSQRLRPLGLGLELVFRLLPMCSSSAAAMSWSDVYMEFLVDTASFDPDSLRLSDSDGFFLKQTDDSVSERLRRWTRNPLGSARRGSNPLAVALWCSCVACFRQCP